MQILLKGLEEKVMDLDLLWGVGPTLLSKSVRERLLVMRYVLKKSVMAVCLVPVLMEGSCVLRKGADPMYLWRLGLIAQST